MRQVINRISGGVSRIVAARTFCAFALSHLLRNDGFAACGVMEIERYEERTTNKE